MNLRVAIGEEPGIAKFFRIVPGQGKTGGGGLSTLRRDILEAHLADGWRHEELHVEVLTLNAFQPQLRGP